MNKKVYLTFDDNDDEDYREAVNSVLYVFKHYKQTNNDSLENVLELLRPYEDLFEIELRFEEDGYMVSVTMFENPLYKQRPNDF